MSIKISERAFLWIFPTGEIEDEISSGSSKEALESLLLITKVCVRCRLYENSCNPQVRKPFVKNGHLIVHIVSETLDESSKPIKSPINFVDCNLIHHFTRLD